MPGKRFLILLISLAALPALAAQRPAESGIEGKWFTPVGRYLDWRREQELDNVSFDIPPVILDESPTRLDSPNALGDTGISSQNTPAQTTQPSQGGASGSTGGSSGSSGVRGFSGGGGFGGGRNFQARSGEREPIKPTSTESGVSSNPFARATLFDSGDRSIREAQRRLLAYLGIPEGPALWMELKVDKKNNLSGAVRAYYLDRVVINVEKIKIEDGTVSGDTFTFTTARKDGATKILSRWKGVLEGKDAIRMSVLLPSGKSANNEQFVLYRE